MAQRSDYTEEEQLAIDDNIYYHKCMIEYLENRKKGEACSLPSKPKRTMTFLEGLEKEKREQTVGELHEFLKSCLVEQEENDITEGDVDRFSKCLTVDEMVPFLCTGFGLLKFNKSKTIHHALILGHWLEKAHGVFKRSKAAQTWTSFLKREVKMDDSYARKLISLSVHFYTYPKFHKLGTSINDLFSKRKLITKYMGQYPDFRSFWQA